MSNNFKVTIEDFDGHSGYLVVDDEQTNYHDKMHFCLPREDDIWDGVGWYEYYPPSDQYLKRIFGENAEDKLIELIKKTGQDE
jgi:hypothetical protein